MKKRIFSLIYLVLIILLNTAITVGQATDRLTEIKKGLNKIAVTDSGLYKTVDLSVNGVSIQEFVRGIAIANNVNIGIDPLINSTIVNNFSNVTVIDVLMYLCEKHDLDIKFYGNIISITKYTAPEKVIKETVYKPKDLKIEYDKKEEKITFDLENDSITRVIKKITELTGKNVIISSELRDKKVNGYILKLPLENALEKLAYSNDFTVNKEKDGNYQISKIDANTKSTTSNSNKSGLRGTTSSKESETEIKIENIDNISINALNAPISDIITEVSNSLKLNYFLFSEIKGNTTVNLNNVSYKNMLTYMLNGTDYTYKLDSNIYMIGERKLERLRETKVIQLQHRSIDKVLEVIPSELQKQVTIKEFPEINSLIVSGSSLLIDEISRFIIDIDKVVPVVLIEVMIVDVKEGYTITTGLTAGLGTAPATTGGSVYPSIDYTMNANSINNVLESLDGKTGFVKLGKVTPNFYVSLKAMEEEGNIKMRSTPMLSTLNSHEATLTIGNTEYYLEESNNIIGSQNPQNIITRNYKPISANMTIRIKPNISGDDQVTLDVGVEQSDFTSKASPNAPRGQVTRSFNSIIRVRNGEMVLLGGLEEKSIISTGSGLPFLSRIPVIKWIFTSQYRKKSKSKLNIFIKPMIVY